MRNALHTPSTPSPHFLLHYTGLVPRTIGIMPEKAFKMQGWNIVGRYTDMFERPTVLKWILAGSAAGAATTIIGEGGVWVGGGGEGVCVCGGGGQAVSGTCHALTYC